MTTQSEGSWLARVYDPETGKQRHHNLGEFSLPDHQRFDAAKEAAEAWFTHVGRGGSTEELNVAQACAAYVTHQRDRKGAAAATDVEQRFKRWVATNHKLSTTELKKLTAGQLEGWRLALRKAPVGKATAGRLRSASSVNRDMTALRAALNLALENGHVTSDHAWRTKLAPIKNADKRRDIYLTIADRRSVIAHADEDLAAFLKALCLIPLRPGALAKLCVQDFDSELRTIHVGQDKAGHSRKLSLPEKTSEFFKEQAKSKLPLAPLLSRKTGTAWNKDAWKDPVKDAVRAAEVRVDATAYSFRHSVITDLVHSGLDTLTVAQLAGTSVAMIEKYYGHLTQEHATSALSRLAW